MTSSVSEFNRFHTSIVMEAARYSQPVDFDTVRIGRDNVFDFGPAYRALSFKRQSLVDTQFAKRMATIDTRRLVLNFMTNGT